MIRTHSMVFALAAGWVLLGGFARGAETSHAVDVDGLGGLLVSFDTTYGYAFTVDAPIRIDALGYLASVPGLLVDAHPVALYHSDGTLIASVTIDFTDEIRGRFFYESITPFFPVVGETYVIGASMPPPSGPFFDLLTVDSITNSHPNITIVEGREGDGFPDTVVSEVVVGGGFLIGGDCATGTVNAGIGPTLEVLRVNGGGTGDDARTVSVDAGDAVWATMLTPPAGGSGQFVVHANLGKPTSSSVIPLPAGIGDGCFPFLLSEGASPVAIWNNIGKTALVGASSYFGGTIGDPVTTPGVFFEAPVGDATNLPAGTFLTFQGIVIDAGSAAGKPASVTNAVVLRVL